jgi:hypothetical protein
MMMAHDSSPGPASLAVETIAAVRTALVRYVDTPSHGAELRAALRAMSAEAREKAIFPEQLLIALKDIWHALPAVRQIEEPADQIRLLQRVVTMCIKEYYSD